MRIAQVITVALFLMGISIVPTAAQGLVAGVEAGANLSRVSPDASGQSITMSPGFFAGVYVDIPFVTLARIQIEGLYTQKNTALGNSTDLKLDYIEIPVLAKLKIIKDLYILEGIGIGIPVRARVQPSSGAERDISNEVTTPDLSLIISGGMPVSSRVAIEGRYDGGFKNVNATVDAIQRNRSWSLLARVHF